MSLRNRTLLTLALATSASPAAAQGFFACPPPGVEQCRDTAWLETHCGQRAAGECFELLADGAMRDGPALPEALRLSPDGELEVTHVQAYDPSGYVHEVEGPAGWAEGVALTAAASTAQRQLADRDAFMRMIWAQNGPALASCEEYVYEKYEAVSRFDDAIAVMTDDAAAAFELAREVTFLAEVSPDPWMADPILMAADGDPIDGEEDRAIEEVARNPWLATPPEILEMRPELWHLADKVRMAEPRPDTLGWHVFAAEALAEVPAEVLEARAADGARYAADLAERQRLVDALESDGGEGDPAYAEGLRAEVASIEESLVAQLRVADALGCLEAAEVGPCDWSPAAVQQTIQDRYDPAREADLQACRVIEQANEGDLTRIQGQSIDDLYGDALYAGRDWLQSVRTFDLYRSLLERARAERERQAQAEREAEARRIAQARAALTGSNGRVRRPEERHHKFSRLGDSNFNLYYEYLMRWRVFDFERILCNVNAEFEAMFRAGATLFGRQLDVIYARLFVNLHRYEGDLRIAGQSLYRDHRNLVGALQFDLVRPTDRNVPFNASASAWFTVVFVPVKVEGGISGKVGLKYQMKAGVDKGGARCTHVAAYVDGKVEPYTRLDAFAALSIDILIARAGIKGRLELLSVSLPFTTRIALTAARGDIRDLSLDIRSTLDFTLRALSGSISLWGEAGWCPFCIKGETVIFRWNGPRWSQKLLDLRLSFPLYGLKRILEGA